MEEMEFLNRNVFEPMNRMLDENDSDLLQALDESDDEWLHLWNSVVKKNDVGQIVIK